MRAVEMVGFSTAVLHEHAAWRVGRDETDDSVTGSRSAGVFLVHQPRGGNTPEIIRMDAMPPVTPPRIPALRLHELPTGEDNTAVSDVVAPSPITSTPGRKPPHGNSMGTPIAASPMTAMTPPAAVFSPSTELESQKCATPNPSSAPSVTAFKLTTQGLREGSEQAHLTRDSEPQPLRQRHRRGAAHTHQLSFSTSKSSACTGTTAGLDPVCPVLLTMASSVSRLSLPLNKGGLDLGESLKGEPARTVETVFQN